MGNGPFHTSVVLPPGLPVSGEILISDVRRIDTLARPIRFAGTAVSDAALDQVRRKLTTLPSIHPEIYLG
jgi:mRNA interferase MazF